MGELGLILTLAIAGLSPALPQSLRELLWLGWQI
jgi:hypothetical protein